MHSICTDVSVGDSGLFCEMLYLLGGVGNTKKSLIVCSVHLDSDTAMEVCCSEFHFYYLFICLFVLVLISNNVQIIFSFVISWSVSGICWKIQVKK